jgi:hypothetical protein
MIGIVNFLIVLGFNLYWLADLGLRYYLELYSWRESKKECIYFSLFAAWGLISLAYFIYTIN